MQARQAGSGITNEKKRKETDDLKLLKGAEKNESRESTTPAKICARHAHPLRQRRVSILQLARVRGADTEARERSSYSKLRRAPLSSAVVRALTRELESA